MLEAHALAPQQSAGPPPHARRHWRLLHALQQELGGRDRPGRVPARCWFALLPAVARDRRPLVRYFGWSGVAQAFARYARGALAPDLDLWGAVLGIFYDELMYDAVGAPDGPFAAVDAFFAAPGPVQALWHPPRAGLSASAPALRPCPDLWYTCSTSGGGWGGGPVPVSAAGAAGAEGSGMWQAFGISGVVFGRGPTPKHEGSVDQCTPSAKAQCRAMGTGGMLHQWTGKYREHQTS